MPRCARLGRAGNDTGPLRRHRRRRLSVPLSRAADEAGQAHRPKLRGGHGGMAANAAAAAVKLRCDAALMSRVGEDANGGFTLAELMVHGVELSAVEQVLDVPTSLSSVAVGGDGERMLFNHQDRQLLLDAPAPPAST